MARLPTGFAEKTAASPGEHAIYAALRDPLALSPDQIALVRQVRSIADDGISRRAAEYDALAAFPVLDIKEIHQAGLLLATLDPAEGGRGYGFHGSDPLGMFLIIENLARASPATAHCVQVHLNTVQMLRAFADEAQRRRFFAPTAERARLLVGAGAEPAGATPSRARRVEGGYVLNGQKHYATNASHADWLWVRAPVEGRDGDVMLVLRASAPGLRIDTASWRPAGMRACVSPMIFFDECFVPQEDVVGRSGQFRGEKWLARINMGFTANYLGALQSLLDHGVSYLQERKRTKGESEQLILGGLAARISAVRLMLYTAVRRCREDLESGVTLNNAAKWMGVDAFQRFVLDGTQALGSSALFRDLPIERLIRDLHVHTLHMRKHAGVRTLGCRELGEPYDLNF